MQPVRRRVVVGAPLELSYPELDDVKSLTKKLGRVHIT